MDCEDDKIYEKKGDCPKSGMDLVVLVPVNVKNSTCFNSISVMFTDIVLKD